MKTWTYSDNNVKFSSNRLIDYMLRPVNVHSVSKASIIKRTGLLRKSLWQLRSLCHTK